MLEVVKFAIMAHHGQKRRFTGEPFVVHPVRVAQYIAEWGYGEPMVKAALLHDTVEDADSVEQCDIEAHFGEEVGRLVEELTNYGDSWKERKDNALKHMKTMSLEAFIVKCADRVDNIVSTINENVGRGKWISKNVTKEQVLWYAEEAFKIADERLDKEIGQEFAVYDALWHAVKGLRKCTTEIK